MDDVSKLRESWKTINSKLHRAKQRLGKAEGEVRRLEADAKSLQRTAEIIGEELPEPSEIASEATDTGRREGGAINLALSVTRRGDRVTAGAVADKINKAGIQHQFGRLDGAVSTAMRRSTQHFRKVKRGLYERISGEHPEQEEETAPLTEEDPSGNGAVHGLNVPAS